MGKPNWAALYQQGRCKAVGVSWTEAEAVAVFKLGIPAGYVRRGVTTLEAYEELKAKDAKVEKKVGEKPLEAMNRDELGATANKAGVVFNGEVADDSLMALIRMKRAQSEGIVDSAPTADAPVEEAPAKEKKATSKKSTKK